jgi:inner membrane protein
MATYLHFAPAVALAVAIGPRTVGWRLTLAGAACAVLPDADFALYLLRIDSYDGPYGHRGFSHSIGFALLVGLLGALLAPAGGRRRAFVGTFLALCTLSHPLIDGLFDRGICNAWRWPLDDARHCLPWRPIPMQGVPLFGMGRLGQELVWIGLPLLAGALAGLGWRRWRAGRPPVLVPTASPVAEGLGPRARRQQRRQAVQALAAVLLSRRARANMRP